MTTTDTDALKEIIAAALWNRALDNGERIIPDCHVLADAILPIVAEEVRKAKAEALDEFAAWAESLNGKHPRFKAENDLAADMAKRFKADNYPHDETGGSDDHR